MNDYISLAPWRGCKYVRENADMYLDELIANGYFHGDSKSWHDKM